MTEMALTFNNWVGGELSSEVFGRYDLPVYKKGAEVLRNFIAKTQGPLTYRTGFEYLNPTKNNNKAVLHHFILSNDIAYVLEFTDKTLRFYRDGGLILDDNGAIYELETPYTEEADLEQIRVAQNADTMYIVHPSFQPRKLTRGKEGKWELKLVKAGGGKTHIPYLYGSEGTNVKITDSGNWGGMEGPVAETFPAWGKNWEGAEYYVVKGSSKTLTTKCTFEEYLLPGEYIFSFWAKRINTGYFHGESTEYVIVEYGSGGSKQYEIVPGSGIEGPPAPPTPPGEPKWYSRGIALSTDKTIKSVTLKIVANVPSDERDRNELIGGIQLESKPVFPFTSENNYPKTVAFAQGRLWYGGTNNAKDKIWGSVGLDIDGTPHYDNFTTGVKDTDSLAFILAPPSGRVEAIEWIASNSSFLMIGTYGGVSKMTGTSDSAAITPESINVRPITSYGCLGASAEVANSTVYYIQRTGKRLREIKYYITEDTFLSDDKNIVSSDVTQEGLKQLEYTVGHPDIMWAVRNDGVLLGVTLDKGEGIAGWHRHYLGGKGFVECITSVPRKNELDQLYAVVRRTINGNTVRYVERLTDSVRVPSDADFYSDRFTENEDEEKKNNAVYQEQLKFRYLDSCITYDGSVYAAFDVEVGDGVLTTVSPGKFEKAWEGRQIWGKYNDRGLGGGRYLIKSVSEDGLTATVKVLAPRNIDTSSSIAKGEWYLTASEFSGVDHLEGQTVRVVAGGQDHPDVKVINGRVVLNAQYPVVHIGFGYTGVFRSTDLELSRATSSPQSTLSLTKRILRVDVKFADTLGARVGSSLYRTERVLDATTDQIIGRPPVPFTGIKSVITQCGYGNGGIDDTETHVVVIQDNPQPCNLLILQPRVDVSDE